MPRLFVYGTLKRGGRLHHEMRGARLVGVRTLEGLVLLDTRRGYPCVVPGEGRVHGEEYEVDEALLRHLDDVEAEEYARRVVDGAWVYMWMGRTDGFPALASGRWRVAHDRSTTRS